MKNRLTIVFLFATFFLRGQDITYENTIGTLVLIKCAPCHRQGEAAPFPLLTYRDLSKRLSFIREVVTTGYMPPWKADNNYVHFANDRSLSEKEKKILIEWIDNKAPPGKLSRPPNQEEISSTYGYINKKKPDLVLQIKQPFLLVADNVERFIIFKLSFDLQDSSAIEAVEFFSSNKQMIHHANFAVHPVDESINIDSTDEYIDLTSGNRLKYNQYLPYRRKINYYGGWVPGTSYESYPRDFGWVLPKRGVILLTVHFTGSPIIDSNTCGIRLFFKKGPVKRKVKVISLGSGGIGEDQISPSLFIKANERKHFSLKISNPKEDFSLLYIWPHMHYIGKEFTAYAVTTENDTIKLVHVADWDYRWQEIYRFKKLVRIPRGSVIHIEAEYDNTIANPANPFKPPQNIFSFGDMTSTNEMMTMMMVFLPYEENDENLQLD